MNLEKSKTSPYYKIAKQALMNWNGLTEEQANEIIEKQPFEQIESQVYAKSSINYALENITKSLKLTDKDANDLSDFVYNGGDNNVIKHWKDENEKNGVHSENKEMYNNIIMDTLFSVHDGWVKDNVKKFDAREKKYQHMPSELIGWNEVKSDLLFVKPIFETGGIEVNEQELEDVYNERVKEFFLKNDIKNKDDLANLISQGENFYPALAGYGETLNEIKNPAVIQEKILPQIEENGIGNIEKIRNNIVSEIEKNPNEEDLSRLSESEQKNIEKDIGNQVKDLTEERNTLHQKNEVIQRIIGLAKTRENLNEEIALEEQKKDENIKGFDGK